MTTKRQEREALAKIRKIVEGLGENSYVGTAFSGVFEIAEQNIEDDAAYSPISQLVLARREAQDMRKRADDATAALKEMEEELEAMTGFRDAARRAEFEANTKLTKLVEMAIRQALILQRKANAEYAKQKALEDNGELFDFTDTNLLEEGARACCEVLWKVYGDIPMRSISAICKIADNNQSSCLGLDNQDYLALFGEAFRTAG